MKSEYEKQADDFLAKTGTTLTVSFLGIDKAPWDKHANYRHKYAFTLSRNGRHLQDVFYNSVFTLATALRKYHPVLGTHFNVSDAVKSCSNKKKLDDAASRPTAYDILTCLQKSDPGTVDDFAYEYGYEFGKHKISEILSVHAACLRQYNALIAMYNDDEMQELCEIN